MAIGLVIDVAVGQAEYEAVMKELGLDTDDAQWPDGIISHTAGPTDGGWRVVDVWASRAKFDQFMEEQLADAMQKAGVPQPQISEFAVHNLHHERAAVA